MARTLGLVTRMLVAAVEEVAWEATATELGLAVLVALVFKVLLRVQLIGMLAVAVVQVVMALLDQAEVRVVLASEGMALLYYYQVRVILVLLLVPTAREAVVVEALM